MSFKKTSSSMHFLHQQAPQGVREQHDVQMASLKHEFNAWLSAQPEAIDRGFGRSWLIVDRHVIKLSI